ncbi:MAG: SCO family protein [Proteobacteria bacterium]|nr:SCO family protein [Pseudomonadota bacterium]
MQKSRTLFIGVITAVVLVVGWLAYSLTREQQALSDQPFGVPFTLTGQDGKPVTEAALRGKSTLLFFGFTHCPEICPTTLFELNGWLQDIDPKGEKVHAFFVTVDPERDTPELLGEYIKSVTERVYGMSGDPAEIAKVLKGYRVYARKVPLNEQNPSEDYTMDHTASVYLLDSKGRFQGTISYGEETDSALSKIRKLIEKG